MNILAEVTIDETGIIKQMDAVKEAADKFEDEALPSCYMRAAGHYHVRCMPAS